MNYLSTKYDVANIHFLLPLCFLFHDRRQHGSSHTLALETERPIGIEFVRETKRLATPKGATRQICHLARQVKGIILEPCHPTICAPLTTDWTESRTKIKIQSTRIPVVMSKKAYFLPRRTRATIQMRKRRTIANRRNRLPLAIYRSSPTTTMASPQSGSPLLLRLLHLPISWKSTARKGLPRYPW